MARQNPHFRHRGPEWFYAAELHQLAMMRAITPHLLPALAALAVLPPDVFGRLKMHLDFLRDLRAGIVEHVRVLTQISGASGRWNDGLVEMHIRPTLNLALCVHPQEESDHLRARQKRFRDPVAAASRAKYDWYCGQGFVGECSLKNCREDPHWLPSPPPMTAPEAESALSAPVALPYLLARPEPLVRQWAFEHLHLLD